MAFVLCLDTLANSDKLYVHVSRPPKPDSPMHYFIQQLEEVTDFTVLCKIWWRPISAFNGLEFVITLPGGFLQISFGEGGISP